MNDSWRRAFKKPPGYLWVSECARLAGTSFYSLAPSFLALKVTRNAGVAGGLILFSGVARVTMMVAGGALVDRYSPRILLLEASLMRSATFLRDEADRFPPDFFYFTDKIRL